MDKKNKNPNVPNLRFREFHTEWEKIQIGNLIKERKEYTSDFEKYPLYSFTIESGITPKSDRYERSFLVKKEGDLFKIVHQNDFVMNPINLRFGALNYSKINQTVSVSGYYDIFTIDACKYNEFWNAYLKTPRMLYTYNTIATGSLVEKKRVYFKQLKELKMCIPSEMEKNKINEFINLLNERIQTQNKIIGDYNSLKKGIIQHIFNVNYEFPNVHLKAILKEISQKNKNRDNIDVLSVSNSLGFIKQSEQFEDREIASADTSNYKIVNKNEYAYNPARINVGSIARLQSCDCGIVSPMYTVFKTDISKISYEYFDLFLQSSTFQKQLNQKLEGSVRQCLTFASMQNILIELPPLEMQIEISEKMKFIDSKIKIESDYLNLLKTEKEYLLKNMFV